jgi:hypothetical protein
MDSSKLLSSSIPEPAHSCPLCPLIELHVGDFDEQPEHPRRTRRLQDLLYYSRPRLKNTGLGMKNIGSGTI